MNVYKIREDGEDRLFIAPTMADAIRAAEEVYRVTEFEIYGEGREYGDEERRDWQTNILEQCMLIGELGHDAHPIPTTQAAIDVLLERRRQVEAEGFGLGHDDEHDDRELARAAECYVGHYCTWSMGFDSTAGVVRYPELEAAIEAPHGWPWDPLSWKPKTPRRDLVRACALLLAEIERLDRLESQRTEEQKPQ